MAWSWPPADAVRLVVRTVGAGGTSVHCCDLRLGRDNAETIAVPEGTQAINIERPQRVRVELGRYRARPQPRPPRPTWRDDSTFIMWWRFWLAGRESRRVARSPRRREERRGPGRAPT